MTRAGLSIAVLLPALFLALFLCPGARAAGDPLTACNVVWNEPSEGSAGSMPLGNGDIGLNVWVEKGGDLRFYIGKTDSWSGLGRLLKLGAVRIRFDPNPFREGAPFLQTLMLRQGALEIAAGSGNERIRTEIIVDANAPVVRIRADGSRPFRMDVSVEVWRTAPRELRGDEVHSARGIAGGPVPLVVRPDTALPPENNRIVWYHHNAESIWPITLRHQGLGDLMAGRSDPLLDRVFGGVVKGEGFVQRGALSLRSAEPRTSHSVAVYALTAHPATPAKWLEHIDGVIARCEGADPKDARAAHNRWWNDFWNRSWVRVVSATGGGSAGAAALNELPLRIGADANGGSRFSGDIAAVQIFSRALEAGEVAVLAGVRSPSGRDTSRMAGALAGSWVFSAPTNGIFEQEVGTGPSAAIKGLADVVDIAGDADAEDAGEDAEDAGEDAEDAGEDAEDAGAEKVRVLAGPTALRLTGEGFAEVTDHPSLNLPGDCTLAAWVRPQALPRAGGRIIDKIPVGASRGFLLDTFPGNSLRFINPKGTIICENALPANEWAHAAATYDSATGVMALYVNGKPVKKQHLTPARPEHEVVTQGYALQRFISACGGRGAMPIKFNGSIFTVDALGFDGDYRRWGGMYWFQNTRLPYWPMLAAGDFDLMRPLFRMYCDALPLAAGRCRTYYGHGGAFFQETMYFWGTPANCDYRWEHEGLPVHLVNNPYIKYYWDGAIELGVMMLDAFACTQDEAMLREELLPFIDAVVTFYDEHYARDDGGALRIHPAQALETWQDATNPLPVVAGLRFLLDGLLALPGGLADADRRARWRRLREELPPIPRGEGEGGAVLLPAETFDLLRNQENPELYAIFPYRLFGVGKDELDLARRTFAQRRVKGSRGWQQDPIQAALLGLAGEARAFVAGRFGTKDPGSRFPAFFGPNFDWTPDQTHGGVACMALQAMLLQAEGRRLIVLPAWPKDWDAEFKLHAPLRTTVEGVVRDGKVVHLKVTPEERAKDIEIMEAQ